MSIPTANIHELEAALNNHNGYNYWTDTQHYHYDHHDYHIMDPQTLYDLVTDGPLLANDETISLKNERVSNNGINCIHDDDQAAVRQNSIEHDSYSADDIFEPTTSLLALGQHPYDREQREPYTLIQDYLRNKSEQGRSNHDMSMMAVHNRCVLSHHEISSHQMHNPMSYDNISRYELNMNQLVAMAETDNRLVNRLHPNSQVYQNQNQNQSNENNSNGSMHQQRNSSSGYYTSAGVMGIPGNPRPLPEGQTEFFSRMHMMPYSSESESEENFNPPFVTSMPTYANHHNNDRGHGHDLNGDIIRVDRSEAPMSLSNSQLQEPSKGIKGVSRKRALPRTKDSELCDVQTKIQKISRNHHPNVSSLGSVVFKSNDCVAKNDLCTLVTSAAESIIHTPLFKSTRDPNGKYHETRKCCAVCKRRINTFCRECTAALCFGDGRSDSATCWEKYHSCLHIPTVQKIENC